MEFIDKAFTDAFLPISLQTRKNNAHKHKPELAGPLSLLRVKNLVARADVTVHAQTWKLKWRGIPLCASQYVSESHKKTLQLRNSPLSLPQLSLRGHATSPAAPVLVIHPEPHSYSAHSWRISPALTSHRNYTLIPAYPLQNCSPPISRLLKFLCPSSPHSTVTPPADLHFSFHTCLSCNYLSPESGAGLQHLPPIPRLNSSFWELKWPLPASLPIGSPQASASVLSLTGPKVADTEPLKSLLAAEQTSFPTQQQ